LSIGLGAAKDTPKGYFGRSTTDIAIGHSGISELK
jgi:hypothetical protein